SSTWAFVFVPETGPEGVQGSSDVACYFRFVMAVCMAVGVAFEVPVAIGLLCWIVINKPEDLRKKRPDILVGAFIVGLRLTTPDVFSQKLLAIAMYCLFDTGGVSFRFDVRKPWSLS
ncbi:twin-arginine translocase subunit TatC, partial [Salmonella enterica]|uniref:twin-arginine translocase subunit TatC n=1 Tax=Salmonella enterica TaxID=28901 RepID=UPI00398C28EF